jgi:DNA-binding NtrC family response regulator
VRILAATHRRLEKDVNSGRFREDLYFRLSVVKLHIPPLGDRKEDIPTMIERFVDSLDDSTPDKQKAVVERMLSMFPDYDWPGNVRELRNMVERIFHAINSAIEFDPFLMSEQVGEDVASASAGAEPLFVDGALRPFKEAKEQLVTQFERGYITRLLDNNSWNISQSAREAKIERAYLQRLIKKHALK